MFISAAISYQLQEYTHRIWINMVHLSVNLAIRGGSFCSSQIAFLNVKSCQNLVNLGTPFLSSILVQKLPKTKKKFNLLGFTHVFDMETSLFRWYLLWPCLCATKFYTKYFYPKYSKFFFSVHTRRIEKVHILCSQS